MAGHLRYGLALQGILKQLEHLSVGGLRNVHTVTGSSSARNIVPCTLIHHLNSRCKPQLHSVQVLSPFNRTEIRDKVTPFKIIEKPETHGFDTSISDPLSSSIKPIKSPGLNKTVIKPPTSETPKSASKNGNMYVLRLRKKRIKRRQLEKLRVKFWPLRKKLLFLKARKKENKLKAHLANLRREGEKYDYLAEIKGQLQEAKKNGYKYDITASLEEAFGLGSVVEEEKEIDDELLVSENKAEEVDEEEQENLTSILSSLKNRPQKSSK